MFERFTQDARLAVIEAQTVARETRSTQIDTRHLLAVLLEADGPARSAVTGAGLDAGDVARRARATIASEDDLDGAALAALGIDLDAVREKADAVFGEGALDRASSAGRTGRRGHLSFTQDAMKAIELALREAIRLKAKTIETRHLLLGILRADSPGGRILAAAAAESGVDLPALRNALERTADAAA
ncbi:hypothetical protein ET471_09105 [Xylanimonas protaetiae]|uniref:Clp R domain-containing protein n=2 Tax=Xylanimonas protaetiae TaxID=2509457 RepID=A0A4P6FDT1_9MICO|nr:hypothetical protein ET471_09105 [Xylanimonas protaetiae]